MHAHPMIAPFPNGHASGDQDGWGKEVLGGIPQGSWGCMTGEDIEAQAQASGAKGPIVPQCDCLERNLCR